MDINQAMQNTTINGWKLFNLRKDGTLLAKNQHHTSVLKVEFGVGFSCKVSRQ